MEEHGAGGEVVWYEACLTWVGKTFMERYSLVEEMLEFFGRVAVTLRTAVKKDKRIPITSLANHIYSTGVAAVPIIGLVAFLIGMVLTYQGIIQLGRFSAELYTIDFLAIGIFREIGVLLTSIVVAGRSASSYTAQIGIMKLNQEVDALQILQLDPIQYLVAPRMIALFISLPVLVFIADIMALVGGMIMMKLVMNLSPSQFLQQFQIAFTPNVFWIGMVKAPLFAIIIGLVGCFRGMKVRETAESVGKMTTVSVVESIFLVIVCNAFLSILFSYLNV